MDRGGRDGKRQRQKKSVETPKKPESRSWRQYLPPAITEWKWCEKDLIQRGFAPNIVNLMENIFSPGDTRCTRCDICASTIRGLTAG